MQHSTKRPEWQHKVSHSVHFPPGRMCICVATYTIIISPERQFLSYDRLNSGLSTSLMLPVQLTCWNTRHLISLLSEKLRWDRSKSGNNSTHKERRPAQAPKLTFSRAELLCVLSTYMSICRTLGHENHGSRWFWQPLHLTSKAKDMWPLVYFACKKLLFQICLF